MTTYTLIVARSLVPIKKSKRLPEEKLLELMPLVINTCVQHNLTAKIYNDATHACIAHVHKASKKWEYNMRSKFGKKHSL